VTTTSHCFHPLPGDCLCLSELESHSTIWFKFVYRESFVSAASGGVRCETDQRACEVGPTNKADCICDHTRPDIVGHTSRSRRGLTGRVSYFWSCVSESLRCPFLSPMHWHTTTQHNRNDNTLLLLTRATVQQCELLDPRPLELVLAESFAPAPQVLLRPICCLCDTTLHSDQTERMS